MILPPLEERALQMFPSSPMAAASAASLSRIGAGYRASHAVSLALRYIPDIQREYRDISLARQAAARK